MIATFNNNNLFILSNIMITYIYLFFFKLCNLLSRNDEINDFDEINEFESTIMGGYNSHENRTHNHNEYFKLNSTYHEEHV